MTNPHEMGSRATAQRQTSDASSSSSEQASGGGGGPNPANQATIPTPAQYIQQHQAAARAQHQQSNLGRNQSQTDVTPASQPSASRGASDHVSAQPKPTRQKPANSSDQVSQSSLSPTSSIMTGHTPLITSPGGTSNPIKLSMSSVAKAAATGRSVLLVQKEAARSGGHKSGPETSESS
jgi:hypothetical protein